MNPEDKPLFEPVIELEAIDLNSYMRIEHCRADILIFRTDQEVKCLENRCPHMGKPLDGGRFVHGKINCPIHGAAFDIQTGQPLCPPAVRPARVFPSRIRKGMVEVDFE